MKKITRILFLALLFGIYNYAYPQTPEEKSTAAQLIAKGDRIMETTRNEIEAQAAYEQAATLDPSNIKANYLAGYYKLIGIKRTQSIPYLEKVKEFWHAQMKGFSAQTPDGEFNSTINTWGIYNALITFAWSIAASLILLIVAPAQYTPLRSKQKQILGC